jgi:hypothetical protein
VWYGIIVRAIISAVPLITYCDTRLLVRARKFIIGVALGMRP